jgi:hypothetical protein
MNNVMKKMFLQYQPTSQADNKSTTPLTKALWSTCKRFSKDFYFPKRIIW